MLFNMLCSGLMIYNMSSEPMTKYDYDTVNRAQFRCIQVYDSCLIKFIKTEPKAYRAICGEVGARE